MKRWRRWTWPRDVYKRQDESTRYTVNGDGTVTIGNLAVGETVTITASYVEMCIRDSHLPFLCPANQFSGL